MRDEIRYRFLFHCASGLQKRGFDDPLCSIVVVQGIGTNQAAAQGGNPKFPDTLSLFLSQCA